eukprot:403373106
MEQTDQRTLSNLKKTQDYMYDHFDRNMSRKSAFRVMKEPQYLQRFKYEQDPELGEEKYKAVKSGDYNMEKEEIQLTQLLKDIRIKTAGQKPKQSLGLSQQHNVNIYELSDRYSLKFLRNIEIFARKQIEGKSRNFQSKLRPL